MSVASPAPRTVETAQSAATTLSRRDALARFGAGLLATGLPCAYPKSGTDTTSSIADPPDWRAIREQVVLSSELIYLNAANLTPGFSAALAVQQAEALAVQRDPSFQARDRFVERSERVRAKLADLLHAQPDEVAIMRNASDANNVIARGLDLQPGSEILLTSANHESNLEPWHARAERERLTVKIATAPVHAESPDTVLESISRELTPRTRVISVTHITNTTGLCYPIAAIAKLARSARAWLHVDGAQSFGWRLDDVREMHCDSYCASMHKWAMGPVETGLLYVRADRLDRVRPEVLSFDYWAQYGSPASRARQFERVGQRDDSKLAGIEKTLEILAQIGFPRIQSRVTALAMGLRTRLNAIPGVRVIGAGRPDVSGPVLRAVWRGRPAEQVAQELWDKRKVALAAADGGLRFSPHLYNSDAELDETAALLAAALRRS